MATKSSKKSKRTETVLKGGKSNYPLIDTSLFDGNLDSLISGLAVYTQRGYKVPTTKLKTLSVAGMYQVLDLFAGSESSGTYAKEGEFDEYALVCDLSTLDLYIIQQNNVATNALTQGMHFSPFNTGEQFKGHEIWGIKVYEPIASGETPAKATATANNQPAQDDDIPF